MNRITKKFQELRKEGKTAFMPFIVAGDPDFETSLKVAKTLINYADFLEIGFPYSDPLADGPTIQAANQRALRAGMNTGKVFKLVKKIRSFTEIPITVLIYANLIYQRRIEQFYRQAKQAGIDGVLVPDLPIEEAEPYVAAAKKAGISPIFLVTQTTTIERLKKILKHAQGYLYLVSVLGVTGTRERLRPETLSFIKRTKACTNMPAAVGFGISDPNHVRSLTRAGADGFIVGSALIKIIEKNGRNHQELFRQLERYIKDLTHE